MQSLDSENVFRHVKNTYLQQTALCQVRKPLVENSVYIVILCNQFEKQIVST